MLAGQLNVNQSIFTKESPHQWQYYYNFKLLAWTNCRMTNAGASISNVSGEDRLDKGFCARTKSNQLYFIEIHIHT